MGFMDTLGPEAFDPTFFLTKDELKARDTPGSKYDRPKGKRAPAEKPPRMTHRPFADLTLTLSDD